MTRGSAFLLFMASPESGRAKPVQPDPTQAAAESPAGSASSPTASGTGAPSDVFDMDAAFASITGPLNSGNDPEPTPAEPAQSAAPATSDKDAASNATGTPPEKEPSPAGREPQPGSRRSTADELEATRTENARLQTLFNEWQKEREDAAAAKAKDDEAKAEAASAVEQLLGKPGEMAALLTKLADSRKPGSDVVFTADDEDRLVELTNGTRLYAPLQERAAAEAAQKLTEAEQQAEGRLNGILGKLADQVASCADLDGIDAAILNDEPDLSKIVRHAHAAGRSSRDDEVAGLQAELLEARGQAFKSQPPLALGGISGAGGRPGLSYDPDKSPQSNLEDIFAQTSAPSNGSGRR